MLSHKNILNGLCGPAYGGKPHDVPEALQSVNMENTSEERRERGRGGIVGLRMCVVCVWKEVRSGAGGFKLLASGR